MTTLKDWLVYYNNLDVDLFIDALNSMRSFYAEREIDILKDAVSLPGVSLRYLINGSFDKAELFAPGKEAYEMLKRALVGGPSIIFTRYHQKGVTRIRNQDGKLCRKILGFDANALYLWCIGQDQPCGKETITQPTFSDVTEKVLRDEWFGFAEVDIEVPGHLRDHFSEMAPIFKNITIPEAEVPQHMLDNLQKTGRKRGEGKKLEGSLYENKIPPYTR